MVVSKWWWKGRDFPQFWTIQVWESQYDLSRYTVASALEALDLFWAWNTTPLTFPLNSPVSFGFFVNPQSQDVFLGLPFCIRVGVETLNSHVFPVLKDGHQLNGRGKNIHYNKDSLLNNQDSMESMRSRVFRTVAKCEWDITSQHFPLCSWTYLYRYPRQCQEL